MLYFLAYAVAGFLILKWIYRTSRNAHSAAAGLPISPPWSVGWYFVPFANLWKPFQALRQTWQVSTDPADWAAVGTPRRLRWWWGLLLTTAILSQLSLRVSQMGKTLVATTASALIDLVGVIPEVALALTLIAVVRELTQLQMTNLVKPNGRPPTTIPLVS